MDKLLITGASGLLGANAVVAAIGKYQVSAICHRNRLTHKDAATVIADLTDDDVVTRLFREIRPHIILHTAALTNIDQCEREPEAAYSINRDMSATIAEQAAHIGAYMIHISTDAIFDGTSESYNELDSPNPINVYGQSKAAAEEIVLQNCPHTAVIRTNFYGWNAQEKLSLAEWFLLKLEQGEPSPGFEDVWFSPILVNHLIEILLEVMKARPAGIFHVAASDCLSKYEFGQRLAEEFGFNPALIQPISVEKAQLEAPRSKHMCLNSDRIESKLNVRMPRLKEGLKDLRVLHDAGYPQQLKTLMARK